MDDQLAYREQQKPIDDELKSIAAFLEELSRQLLDAVDDAVVVAVDSKSVKFSLVTNGVTMILAKRLQYSIELVMVASGLEVAESPSKL